MKRRWRDQRGRRSRRGCPSSRHRGPRSGSRVATGGREVGRGQGRARGRGPANDRGWGHHLHGRSRLLTRIHGSESHKDDQSSTDGIRSRGKRRYAGDRRRRRRRRRVKEDKGGGIVTREAAGSLQAQGVVAGRPSQLAVRGFERRHEEILGARFQSHLQIRH